MRNKKSITEKEFLENTDTKDILDEDETWEQYKKDMERQDQVRYYKSGDIYFFQTAGFEYFWEKK